MRVKWGRRGRDNTGGGWATRHAGVFHASPRSNSATLSREVLDVGNGPWIQQVAGVPRNGPGVPLRRKGRRKGTDEVINVQVVFQLIIAGGWIDAIPAYRRNCLGACGLPRIGVRWWGCWRCCPGTREGFWAQWRQRGGGVSSGRPGHAARVSLVPGFPHVAC